MMEAKYWALALIAVGIILIIIAVNTSSDFDDGSFIVTIGLAVLGVACILAGGGIFAVKLFMGI